MEEKEILESPKPKNRVWAALAFFIIAGGASGLNSMKNFDIFKQDWVFMLMPGVLFGIALIQCIRQYKSFTWWKALIVLVASSLGYFAAFEITMGLSLKYALVDTCKIPTQWWMLLPFKGFGPYFIGGFTGTFILTLGLPKMFKLANHSYLTLPLLGALASSAFFLEQIFGIWISFFLWQSIVGAYLVYLFQSRKPKAEPIAAVL
ncbi:MAG: hypothetical protein NTX03_03020 [Bacteroidetes bacterium]|nr:hypothetical protein [Bacteroidota bacterium]